MITTLIIDRGHATLSTSGKYVTPGKQFLYTNGTHVYEGFENQKYAETLSKKGIEAGFKIEFTVKPNDPRDPSLADRVKIANSSPNKNSAIFLSLHNNAGGGVGTEIFTSIGATLADKYCESIFDSLKKIFPNRVLRTDTRDGDSDKEENFYVLKYTSMPAILFEFGFFDRWEDYVLLSSQVNIDKFCDSIIDGIKNYNNKIKNLEVKK